MYTAICNSDIAHTIGNVTYIMTEFIRNTFPKNFFNYTHLSTMMPYKEFMFQENRLRQASMIKKERPILIVRPKPIMFDDDIFMARSNLTSPVYSTINNPDRGNYIRLLRDDKNDITISYMMNRMRVQCQCTIIFDTMIQQINVYNYLRNLFIDSRVYRMPCALEVFVPREAITYISQLSKNDIRDPESGSVRKFLEYLNMNSSKYWTFKDKNNTQTEEFFVYYPIQLEYVFTDWSLNDPSKIGDVEDYSSIDFVMTTEFNTIGMFQLSTERDDTVLKANTVLKMDMSNGAMVRPYYTIDNLFQETNKDGWKLFFTNIFNIDDGLERNEPDILDLSSIFKDSDLQEILDYNLKHGISNDVLFDFVIMKNGDRLNGDRTKGKLDYVIDLDNQLILIYNKNTAATYRILIYVNNLYIMTLFNSISEVEVKYEKPRKPII